MPKMSPEGKWGFSQLKKGEKGIPAWRNFMSKTKTQGRSQNIPDSMLQEERTKLLPWNLQFMAFLSNNNKIKCLDDLLKALNLTGKLIVTLRCLYQDGEFGPRIIL